MGLPQPGEIFDNYKVLKILGEGGMGLVFLAEDIKLSRKVALKFLGDGSKRMDSKTLMRFENEAKILASLSHPNIVNIYTFGTYAGIHYLVMEYVKGVTLSRVIEKKSFGVMDALKAIKEIVKGLQAAHDKGILHRDIKPANLLVGDDNQIKIVDFGISKSLIEDDPKLTKENHFIGTLNYMAPEILKGHPPTPASDLFSVGVVFYELLTGTNPFNLASKIETIDMIRNEQLALPESVCQLLPPELQSVISKLIAKEKENRYQSTDEVLQDLGKISESLIPDFHGVSLRPEIVVTNREEIRLSLLQRNYSEQEIEIIVKLAVKLVELRRASEEVIDDNTVDLSQSSKPSTIHIDHDSLNIATENFEKSKASTKVMNRHQAVASTDEIDFVGKKKSKIPFPLFRPKTVITFSLVIGFLFLNYAISENVLKSLGFAVSPLDVVTGLLNPDNDSSDGKDTPTLAEVTGRMKNVAERKLSSVPAGQKKPLPEGTRIKYKAVKFNSITGDYEFNQVNTLAVKKLRGSTMYSYFQDGKTGVWSSQHISSNAFLPPLRWYSKKLFNIAVTPKGNYDNLYPLHIGKSATFSYKTLVAGGAFTESERSCTVKDAAKKTVAGQAIDVFVVKCDTTTDDLKISGLYYYSPAWNLIIEKVEKEESRKGKFEGTTRIESIQFPEDEKSDQ